MEFDEHLLRHKMELFTLSQQVFVWIERHLALRLHLAFVSEAGCGCESKILALGVSSPYMFPDLCKKIRLVGFCQSIVIILSVGIFFS